MLYTHNVLQITLLHLNTAKNCGEMKQSRAKHQFFFLSDMLILSPYKQPAHGSFPKHLNQSAWQDASNSCLIDALIQSLSSAALWSLPKANTTHTRVINELLLKQESGAGLTEHLWTIDQGKEVHTPELQTLGLKQRCFLIWWHFKEMRQQHIVIVSPTLL